MTKRILLIALCFVLVAALVFTGCAPARRPYTNVNPGTRTGYTTPGTTGYETGYGNRYGTTTGYGKYNNVNYDTQKSDQIAAAVKNVQGVQNATVVLNGNTAYVGIVLQSTNVNAADTNTIKSRVAQVVRTTAPSVNTVYVSTDVGFMNRLRAVGEGLRSGRALNTFTTELNNMIRGIAPARW